MPLRGGPTARVDQSCHRPGGNPGAGALAIPIAPSRASSPQKIEGAGQAHMYSG